MPYWSSFENPCLEENTPKKALSVKEKYELTREANPAVDDLIRELKLKIDHGA